MYNEHIERRLEAIVDSNSIATVVGSLASLCYERAARYQACKSNSEVAKRWEKVAKRLDIALGEALNV